MSEPCLLIQPVLSSHKREVWETFASHHYLTVSIHLGARCWVATWDDNLVAFTSALTMPSGTLRYAWREHRTVVIPDYQGLGIGAILTDWLGARICAEVHEDGEHSRFYSRTSHPRLAQYRRSHPELWRETKKSGKLRKEWWSGAAVGNPHGERATQVRNADTTRPAFSFEYIGNGTSSLSN